VFVPLLSVPIVLSVGSSIIVHFAAGVSNSSSSTGIEMAFRIVVDATVFDGVGVENTGANKASSVALLEKISGLAAGAHTVTIEWQVPHGTGQIRPVTSPNDESANLVVYEVNP
jgi:hypothetical protein